MIEALRLSVSGMTCGGCENAVKRAVMKLTGVQEVKASHRDGSVVVACDPDKVSLEAIRSQIEALGYQVQGPPR